MKSQFLPVSFSRKTCCPPSRLEPISPGISPLKRLPFAWAALCLIILLIGALAARADYPSILVIDSVGYAGTPVSGIDAEEYDTGGNGVLILYVSTGGTAVWGDNLNDALNSPS